MVLLFDISGAGSACCYKAHGAIRQDRASIVNIALWADLVLQSGLDVGEFDT